MQRKHLKQFPLTMKQCTESMNLIKWPRNIFAELAHWWPIHSFQNTLDLAAINAWIFREVTNEKISGRNFVPQ